MTSNQQMRGRIKISKPMFCENPLTRAWVFFMAWGCWVRPTALLRVRDLRPTPIFQTVNVTTAECDVIGLSILDSFFFAYQCTIRDSVAQLETK